MNRLRSGLAALLLGFAGAAQADGLADLKAALERVDRLAPVRGTLDAAIQRRQGDGDEAIEETGAISVGIQHDSEGMRVGYAPDLLARAESERLARDRDPKAKTPVLTVIQSLRFDETTSMVDAAELLSRILQRARFSGERPATHEGQAARVLAFDLALGNLSARFRKYIRGYEGSLELTIAADGTPMAMHVREKVSARAFLVLSFKTETLEDSSFAMVGKRLIASRRQLRRQASGAGENFEELLTLRFSPASK